MSLVNLETKEPEDTDLGSAFLELLHWVRRHWQYQGCFLFPGMWAQCSIDSALLQSERCVLVLWNKAHLGVKGQTNCPQSGLSHPCTINGSRQCRSVKSQIVSLLAVRFKLWGRLHIHMKCNNSLYNMWTRMALRELLLPRYSTHRPLNPPSSNKYPISIWAIVLWPFW